jgi:hypothetical protein
MEGGIISKRYEKQNTIFLSILYPLSPLWQRITVSIRVHSWLIFRRTMNSDQSTMINYAKQTQFFKKSNVYNRNFNNQLQRKTNCGHLVKTNPNEPNFKKHTHLPRAGFAIAASAPSPYNVSTI